MRCLLTILQNRFAVLAMVLHAVLVLTITPAHGQYKDIDELKARLARTPLNDTNRVNLHNKIAFSYGFVNLIELRRNADLALKLAEKLNFKRGIAESYKNIGLAYMLKNAHPKALDYFNKALKTYRSIGDHHGASRALNNMGYFCSVIKDYKESNNFYRQALAEIQSINDIHSEALLIGNLGNNYEKLNQIETAGKYYREMLKLVQRDKGSDLLGVAYINMAQYYVLKGKGQQALNVIDKAFELDKQLQQFDNQDLSDIYALMGKAYFTLKNYNQAERLFSRSLELAKKVEYAEIILENHHNFYQLDTLRGNYKSALNHLIAYSQLRDSLTNVNKNKQIAFYQIKFQTEKNLAENQRLRKEKERNQEFISEQRTRQFYLIITMVLILLVVFMLVCSNRRIESKNRIIRHQNENLEQLNLVKNKLFSVIAHDLRSPFAQIIPLLEMFEDGKIKPEEFTDIAASVKTHFEEVLLLMDNLLFWAKSQLNGFSVNRQRFNVHVLAEEVLAFFGESLDTKNLTIKNQVDPMVYASADKEMIKIVLRNLVSNAIKFTKPGGEITVQSKTDTTGVTISVIDSGIGIKPQDLNKLFAMNNFTTRGTLNERGTGMGLRICKDFVEVNAGTLQVESVENVGTTFLFTLPDEQQVA